MTRVPPRTRWWTRLPEEVAEIHSRGSAAKIRNPWVVVQSRLEMRDDALSYDQESITTFVQSGLWRMAASLSHAHRNCVSKPKRIRPFLPIREAGAT